MGWAVILLPDERGDAAARRVWSAICRVGCGTMLFDGDNRPHVSLTLLETQDGTLDAVAQKFAAEAKPAEVTFASIGHFGEDVIFLSPEPSSALHAMNRALTAKLGPLAALADRHYLPGEWQPHLTVAYHVPEGEFSRAWQAARESFVPFSTVLDRIAVVKFHPVKIMGVYPLGLLKPSAE